MAGKHRVNAQQAGTRGSRDRAGRRWAPALTAAAMSATGLSTALITGTSSTGVVTVPVELAAAAVITPANSTAQIFASSDYYNDAWKKPLLDYGSPQVVPFFLGPQGIADSIASNSTNTDGTVVLASGWGAGQTGTALGLLADQDPTALDNVTLVILDNNSNRAGGGFWTTYAPFAPLLGTSADPTPSGTGVPIVDVAYEYNINSDAPTYPVNLLADANSLAAYIEGYGGQATAPVPAALLTNPPAAGEQHYHYVLNTDGTPALDENGVEMTYPVDGDITYVTIKSGGLPLVAPLRAIPGGSIVADAIEPTLTVLVDAGYQDNSPIPQDPTETRPMGLFPSAAENADTVSALQDSIGQGAPTSTPLARTTTETTPKPNRVKTALTPTTGNKFFPKSVVTRGSSAGSTKPVQKAFSDARSALGGLADNLKKATGSTSTDSGS